MKEFKQTKFHFGPIAKTFNKKCPNIIVDENIYHIYKDHFKNKLVYITPAGEACKNLKEVEKCLEFFLEKGVTRNSHLIVIGGGATSDFGGFVASILLRGINWSVIPTTLLSMVDSSIGGKTGVNSALGKNLIGTFHLPESVWIDIDFLNTLPQKEIESGMGEILKYAFLVEDIYQLVMNDSKLEDIIQACVNYKNEIVRDDFRESGKRKILNLGHTIGHALEVQYKLAHGEAVRWGLFLILKLFKKEDLLLKFKELNQKIYKSFQLPDWLDQDLGPLMDLIKKDKKRKDGDHIELVTLEDIGRPQITPMALSDLKNELSAN